MTNVLILDNDIEILDTLKLVLESYGHNVWVARDGAYVENLITHHHITFVITDIYMPHNDGFEVIKSLEKNHPKVIVFAISGVIKTDFDCLQMAKGLGAEEVFRKPVIISDLEMGMKKWGVPASYSH